MRRFQRLSKEEMELGHTIELFRAAPDEVLAEREAAWVAEWTPNINKPRATGCDKAFD